MRLRGIGQLAPEPRARAKAIAVWREKLARERDLPRAWILSDAAMFSIAQADPAAGRARSGAALERPVCGDAARGTRDRAQRRLQDLAPSSGCAADPEAKSR